METYPTPVPTKLVVPGELLLDRVTWIPAGARVTGTVGGVAFDIAVETGNLLDRKRFTTAVWRFKKLLAILPTIDAWQDMIRNADGVGSR